jgi:protein O-GlcNAc transferase
MLPLLIAAVLAVAQVPSAAQPPVPDMHRAEQHDTRGWSLVQARDFAGSVREFNAALQINAGYADALHGLGKAYMGLGEFAQAAQAFERCRDAYERAGNADAEHRALSDRAREARIRELEQRLAELQSHAVESTAQSSRTEVLEMRQQIRELSNARDSGPVIETRGAVPAFVSLALGSAYFRLDRLVDAERLFRAALAVDPAFGEAHSNLALVCLLTARAEEAQQHVRLAEEARFKVNPELKRRIKAALDERAK